MRLHSVVCWVSALSHIMHNQHLLKFFWRFFIYLFFALEVENQLSSSPFSVSDAVVDPLTVGLVLGAALRDVGAEHHPDSGVHGEAPGELLAVWIPTVVLSQVSGKQKRKSFSSPTVSAYGCGAERQAWFPPVADSLAGVGLRCERVVVGILGVPPLAGEARWGRVYGPSVSLSSALVTFGCFHHVAFGVGVCKRVEVTFD